MISMTMPQYRRRECSINGTSVHLRPMYIEVLSTLLAAGPRFVSRTELIEAIWPNPELEPDYAWTLVDHCILSLRRAGVSIETHWGIGWRVPLWEREVEQRLAA